jgi:hypothetical protein
LVSRRYRLREKQHAATAVSEWQRLGERELELAGNRHPNVGWSY